VDRTSPRQVEPHVLTGLPVARRTALTVSAAGISTLLLPAGAAAASELTFTPAAFAYDVSTDRPVAAWLPFDAADPDSYTANNGQGVAALTIARDGLAAHLTQAGTTTSASSSTTGLGDPEVRGTSGAAASEPTVDPDPPNELIQSTDGHSTWHMRNSRSRADTLGLAGPPHLSFSITVNSGTLRLATLVLHAVRNVEPSPGVTPPTLNLAAYVTAPGVADGAPMLRRTASLISDGARHIVINLGLQDRTFTGGTITVRLYPVATPDPCEVRFERFDPDSEPQPLTDADTVRTGGVSGAPDVDVNSGLMDRRNWMAAFIGSY
jgi:hypothetical protein